MTATWEFLIASEAYQPPHDRAGGTAARTVISFLAGAAFVLLSSWAGFGVAFYIAGMSCDESCSGDKPPPGADWAEYSDAAQWTALGWLGVASVVLALTAASLVMSGRRRLALAFVGGYRCFSHPGGSVGGRIYDLASALAGGPTGMALRSAAFLTAKRAAERAVSPPG